MQRLPLRSIRWRLATLIALLGALLLCAPDEVWAQPDPPTRPLTIATDAAGVHIRWLLAPNHQQLPASDGWQLLVVGGLRVPGRLLTLASAAPLSAPLVHISARQPWITPLSAVDAPTPQTSTGDPRPDLAIRPAAGPASPLTILRSSRIGGQMVSIVALSPLIITAGDAWLVTAAELTIPGATLYNPAQQANPVPAIALATSSPAPPGNQAALGPAWRLTVSAEGIQQVSGADLAAAGASLSALHPERLRLWHAGAELALELSGSSDGRLDPVDTLRFYAPTPGDRWNRSDTYWLTQSAGAGLRMSSRRATAAAEPLRTTAIEQGTWQQSQLYDSTLSGPDGDHWYSADLRSGPGQPAAAHTALISSTLPVAVGPLTLTLRGAAYISGQHHLVVEAGAARQALGWSGTGDWSHTVTLDTQASAVTLRLLPGAAPSGIELDQLIWQRPVQLSLAGQGAIFSSVAGTARYQLSGTNGDQALYDLSDSQRPVRLTGWAGSFQDGPQPRRYLLTGPGTLFTPGVAAYTPATLPQAADALYIAPADLHPTLAPLLAHRSSQGHRVAVVDIQAIYDRWSFGQVDPAAIRSFLRHSAASLSPALHSITLVGDGSADPHNYSGRNSVNLIPPYLAPVDPWLGETACENCYVQLDGANPLDDLLPDLAIGRLPVKSAAELALLVAKLIAYDATEGGLDWRARQIYLADNSYAADGRADPAGDFAAESEAIIQLQPASVTAERIYYDPWGRDAQGRLTAAPGHIADAPQARAQTRAALNRGAGVVVYLGHSHQWQWAVTDQSDPAGTLLGLYDPDLLSNGARLPVVLALTCLSSAFQTPSYSGTTIDERLVLASGGGAVAVWGSTGLGVSYGHATLARGFFDQRWSNADRQVTLGALTMAGYTELFTGGSCCQDALRTFSLLGDALTPARMLAPERLMLPLIVR